MEIPPRAGRDRGAVALCLEIHDLVLAKCVAGRGRDWEFAGEALEADLVEIDKLLALTDNLPAPASDREHIRAMLTGITA